jgi:hypothetical protein
MFVSNRLVLEEISYQTILQGFNTSFLKETKKRIFITYNFSLGNYELRDMKQPRQEASVIIE